MGPRTDWISSFDNGRGRDCWGQYFDLYSTVSAWPSADNAASFSLRSANQFKTSSWFAFLGHPFHPSVKRAFLPFVHFSNTASDADWRPLTPPKKVDRKSGSPTYRGPSSDLRTLSTSWRYSEEFAKLLVLWSHGVCWREEIMARGGGVGSVTAL